MQRALVLSFVAVLMTAGVSLAQDEERTPEQVVAERKCAQSTDQMHQAFDRLRQYLWSPSANIEGALQALHASNMALDQARSLCSYSPEVTSALNESGRDLDEIERVLRGGS